MKKKTPTSQNAKQRTSKTGSSKWHLKLYIAGKTGRSQTALRNLETLCQEYLKGMYTLEVIDLIKQPKLAKGDQIFAIPTLIKKVPKPVRKIIGDLSDIEKVLVGLDLKSVEAV
jgi:circadian clock protein KaiB